MLPPHFPRRRLQRLMNFGALSRGFGTCCLRFRNDVATVPARLTSGWLARLCREGVDPLDRCKRFQVIHPPFLDLAWRKGSFILMLPSWSLYSTTSSARGSSVNCTVRPSVLLPIPSELPLSKMKIALLVRQLDLGHILWCGRVVRVKHAHRIRVVRGVLKMLDVGRHGVIDFGHIRFVARDRAVTYVFHEDKFVERCVAQQRAGDIDSACEGWLSRSMSPARVTRQRRQSRRIVWDDRARMRAVVISELEAIRLVYVSLRMGRVSSIRPNVKMAAAVISELEVGQFAYVNRSVVLRGRTKRVVGRLPQRVVVAVRGGVGFRIVDRVMIQLCLERLGGVVPA